jgi:hypothetical protein
MQCQKRSCCVCDLIVCCLTLMTAKNALVQKSYSCINCLLSDPKCNTSLHSCVNMPTPPPISPHFYTTAEQLSCSQFQQSFRVAELITFDKLSKSRPVINLHAKSYAPFSYCWPYLSLPGPGSAFTAPPLPPN